MKGRLPDPGDNLLRAGIDAIQVGLEDFEQESVARKTAAIRNLYAGVLLLCKHHLVELAPSDAPLLLIAANTKFERQDDEVRTVAVGKTTIGAKDIMQRFEDLGVDLDLTHLRTLQRLRNEIEHYFSKARDEDFESAFVEVQLLVADLLSRIDPEIDLGRKWKEMVVRSNAFEKRREKSRQDLGEIKWMSKTVAELVRSDPFYFECPECGSSHIARKDASFAKQGDVDLVCLQCGSAIEIPDLIESLLSFRFFREDHEAAKGGEIYQVYPCPECERETFVTQEEQCANCGAGTDDYSCEHCGEPMPIWGVNAGNPYCSDDCAHIAYQIAKDD